MCHEKMYKFSCTLTRERKFFNISAAHPVSFVLARGIHLPGFVSKKKKEKKKKKWLGYR